jgi:hypothetical protein
MQGPIAFRSENLKERENSGDLGVGERKLKRILKEIMFEGVNGLKI